MSATLMSHELGEPSVTNTTANSSLGRAAFPAFAHATAPASAAELGVLSPCGVRPLRAEKMLHSVGSGDAVQGEPVPIGQARSPSTAGVAHTLASQAPPP